MRKAVLRRSVAAAAISSDSLAIQSSRASEGTTPNIFAAHGTELPRSAENMESGIDRALDETPHSSTDVDGAANPARPHSSDPEVHDPQASFVDCNSTPDSNAFRPADGSTVQDPACHPLSTVATLWQWLRAVFALGGGRPPASAHPAEVGPLPGRWRRCAAGARPRTRAVSVQPCPCVLLSDASPSLAGTSTASRSSPTASA